MRVKFVRKKTREREKERRINSKVLQYQTFQLKSYVSDVRGREHLEGWNAHKRGRKNRKSLKKLAAESGARCVLHISGVRESAHDR